MTLPELNQLPLSRLKKALATCCGSSAWVNELAKTLPLESNESLFEQADIIWYSLTESDWWEAFADHPKIGDIDSLREKFGNTETREAKNWAEGEQAGVSTASQQVLDELAEGNRRYEEKFGYIFIVCATGKSAPEMLETLTARLPNPPEAEILIASQEQAKIIRIRLEKLVAS
jgi:2-oxo-4-hydroxy-4-carboxy-5-ureidoimidazoline decarboxylase